MSMSLLSQPPANLLPLSNLARNPYISTKTRDKRIDFKPKSSDIQGIGIVSSDKSNTIGLGLSVCEIYRRKLLSYAVWWPLSYALTRDPSRALEMDSINADTNFAFQTDEINAYMFAYPLEVPSRHYKLKWIVSRKPERYSSAAPLSADARQRIVSEILDIKDNLVISVSVGPPNDQFLTSKDKSAWNAKNVAESVLSDKSTARLTTGQRVTESSILEAHCNNVAGEPYWYYEHLARKSPTAYDQTKDVFRHALSVTAEREGYLYSLNASALSSNWKTMEPLFRQTISSFRLLPPTKNYVPPYKDPWRFW